MNAYGEPSSQAIGDKWIQSAPPSSAPTDADRFSVELERISASLLDLNTLLTDRLAFYAKPEGCLGAEKVKSNGSVYRSSYFNNLGNLTDSMQLNISLINSLIENLEL